MIRKLIVEDVTKTIVPWWKDVPNLKAITELEFKPGLNAIYGPNGSGKSTILSVLAKTLCCHQGGRQVVTGHAISDLRSYEGWNDGIKIDHDGSPTMYFDPGAAVGLIGGMAGFDYDFICEGGDNATFKGSSGQTTARRMWSTLHSMIDNTFPEIKWKVDKDEYIQKILSGTGPRECPTVLLDEPSRSLDLWSELGFWRIVDKAVAAGIQVIVVTHSVFPLNRGSSVNYIETVDEYISHTRADLELYYLLPQMIRLRKEINTRHNPSTGN